MPTYIYLQWTRKEAVGLAEAEKPGLDFSCYLIVKIHVELHICILSIFFIYVMSCSMFFFFLKSLRFDLTREKSGILMGNYLQSELQTH